MQGRKISLQTQGYVIITFWAETSQVFKCLETDLAELEQQLFEAKDRRLKMIITDGVFSMDGEIAPLVSVNNSHLVQFLTKIVSFFFLFFSFSKICDLGDKYNALVFVDECHATGFMGKTGRFVFFLILFYSVCIIDFFLHGCIPHTHTHTQQRINTTHTHITYITEGLRNNLVVQAEWILSILL